MPRTLSRSEGRSGHGTVAGRVMAGRKVARVGRPCEAGEMDGKGIYFDNGILNDLQQLRGVSAAEVGQLRDAAKWGAFTPKLSSVIIEEVLAALVKHEALALDLFRLVSDLYGLETMIKPPDQLLTDDFVDLAFGDPLRPPEIQMPVALRWHLEALLHADAAEVAELTKAAVETSDEINDLWAKLKRAREQSRAELGPKHQAEPFEQYRREIAPALVEAYAEKVGVWRKCRDEVGLEKLLSTPSIGMLAGANASMIYARVVENRRADRGDAGDQKHALMASAADVFVTGDSELRRILQRVPLARPEVVDLNQFLLTLGIR